MIDRHHPAQIVGKRNGFGGFLCACRKKYARAEKHRKNHGPNQNFLLHFDRPINNFSQKPDRRAEKGALSPQKAMLLRGIRFKAL